MPLKEQLLKMLIYAVCRDILVRGYLLVYHLPLLLQFLLRECGGKCYLHKEVDGLGKVFPEHRCVEHSLLLCSVCIKLSPYPLQGIVYGRCPLCRCPLKEHVLSKMGQSVICRLLIPGAAFCRKGTICYGRRGPFQ